MREQLFSKAVDSGGRLLVRSALNPILWLCAIITIPTIFAGVLHPNLPIWIIVVGCSPVPVALIGFLFLLIFDRDKLQSEDYQIRKRTVELAQEKGGDPIPIETGSLLPVENPDVRSLPNRDGGPTS